MKDVIRLTRIKQKGFDEEGRFGTVSENWRLVRAIAGKEQSVASEPEGRKR